MEDKSSRVDARVVLDGVSRPGVKPSPACEIAPPTADPGLDASPRGSGSISLLRLSQQNPCLLAPEGPHRVDPGGSEGWGEVGRRGHGQEDRPREGVGEGVERTDTVEEGAEDTANEGGE
jgi:hypothetical protein